MAQVVILIQIVELCIVEIRVVVIGRFKYVTVIQIAILIMNDIVSMELVPNAEQIMIVYTRMIFV